MIAFTIYFGSLLGYYSSSAYYSYIYYATSFFIFSYFFYYSLKPGFFLNDLCSTISSDSLDSFYGSMISYFGGIFSFLLLLIFVLDLTVWYFAYLVKVTPLQLTLHWAHF